MRCPNPITIPRPGGGGAKDRISVPCGKCVFCLSNKRADWSFRISEELRASSSAFFITLTYAEENVPKNELGIPELDKREIQLFLKRLRKSNEKWNNTLNKLNNSKIRYFLCGEYGSKSLRPHYHIILFNVNIKTIEKINDAWTKGFVQVGSVSPASIHYVTKYFITKNDNIPGELEKPFNMMSLKPGIGKSYLTRTKDFHQLQLINAVKNSSGFYQKMPKYYADKQFTQQQKNVIKTKAYESSELAEQGRIQKYKGTRSDYYNDYLSRIEAKRQSITKQITKNEKL